MRPPQPTQQVNRCSQRCRHENTCDLTNVSDRQSGLSAPEERTDSAGGPVWDDACRCEQKALGGWKHIDPMDPGSAAVDDHSVGRNNELACSDPQPSAVGYRGVDIDATHDESQPVLTHG